MSDVKGTKAALSSQLINEQKKHCLENSFEHNYHQNRLHLASKTEIIVNLFFILSLHICPDLHNSVDVKHCYLKGKN
jgi:hypothetical protein